jgi:hypothetical protein
MPKLKKSKMATDKKAIFITANAVATFNKEKDKWNVWLERLENAFKIFGISEEADKIALILHCIGQDAYHTLSNKVLPDKLSGKKYEDIKTAMKEINEPDTLEVVECFKFHSMKQKNIRTPWNFQLS